nr:MAG TPA: hypothetical protein [Caudoviricetes sp.]
MALYVGGSWGCGSVASLFCICGWCGSFGSSGTFSRAAEAGLPLDTISASGWPTFTSNRSVGCSAVSPE